MDYRVIMDFRVNSTRSTAPNLTRADKQWPSLQRAPAVLRHGPAPAPTGCFHPLTKALFGPLRCGRRLPVAIDQTRISETYP